MDKVHITWKLWVFTTVAHRFHIWTGVSHGVLEIRCNHDYVQFDIPFWCMPQKWFSNDFHAIKWEHTKGLLIKVCMFHITFKSILKKNYKKLCIPVAFYWSNPTQARAVMPNISCQSAVGNADIQTRLWVWYCRLCNSSINKLTVNIE